MTVRSSTRGERATSGKGMMVALLLAAVAMPASTAAQDRTVATIDGRIIGEGELALAEKEHGTDIEGLDPVERRRALIELVIQRRLLANAAEAAGLGRGADFDLRLAHARRRVLQDLLLEQRMRAVSEADARRLYDGIAGAFKPEDEVSVRHILVASRSVASALADRIVEGERFAELAKGHSLDRATARRGGDLGWRVRGELPNALASAAFALAPGRSSSPLQSASGWHLLFVEARRQRTMPAFARVKDHLLESAAKTALHAIVRDLRAKARVEIFEPER